jgi:hypothetical protein
MSMTDPIADFLTRVRNALKAQQHDVKIPASGIKREIARILRRRATSRTGRSPLRPPVPATRSPSRSSTRRIASP